MYVFQIRIADITVGVDAEYINTMRRCEGYLVENQQEDFHIHVSPEDTELEEKIFVERSKARGIENPEVFGFRIERNAVYRIIAEKMIDYDRLLIHGSAIAMDQRGYLFIAPSGTGKSTHTRLWREVFGSEVVMVNDDKPLIHVQKDGILIYGTPWDGKHHLSTNIGVPLKGICRICRSENNRMEKMSAEEGMTRVLEQTYRSRDPFKLIKTMDLLKQIVNTVPVYTLYCNMDPEAAVTAYETLRSEDNHEA